MQFVGGEIIVELHASAGRCGISCGGAGRCLLSKNSLVQFCHIRNLRGHVEMMAKGAAPFQVLEFLLDGQSIVILTILTDQRIHLLRFRAHQIIDHFVKMSLIQFFRRL